MKGLSFSEPMVKAWMEGRKSVTRRLIKKQPVSGFDETFLREMLAGSFYHPGETVYIKETWALPDPSDHSCVCYKAAGDPITTGEKWRSPRFMPECFSRSHALIKSVRPERIKEITPEEAISEGIEPKYCCDGTECGCMGRPIDNPVDDFQNLWESLHPGSWERNDFVWRIELEAV